jgi:hypothetical protein
LSERTQNSTSVSSGQVRCEDMNEFALLYACDELDPGVRAAVEAHASQCSACAAIVLQCSRVQQAIGSLKQPSDSLDPSGLLLPQCRSELAEALDDRRSRSRNLRWRAIISPFNWWTVFRNTLVYHPAMSMVTLVVVGFLAGVAGQRLPQPSARVARPALVVSSTPKLTMQQLQSAASANVAWVTPSDTRSPAVQVQLMSPTPMSIVGPPDDADVERALTFVLENGRQFEPSVRLDSLDVLRTQAADPEVCRVLCATARSDQNPGVRMKALEALQDMTQEPLVRRTILEALQNDSNSGVRVAAMNLLLASIGQGGGPQADAQVLSVLRDRVRNDPNHYIRLKSAAVLRQLGSDDTP